MEVDGWGRGRGGEVEGELSNNNGGGWLVYSVH